MRALFVVLTLLFFVNPLWAMDIAGVEFEEKVVNDAGTPLQLNGAGIRKKFFMKIYAAGLYLENPHDDAAQVLADEGAKRIVMHFIYDEVGKDKIVEGWNEGFSANVNPESLASLQTAIATFNAMFDEDMKADDVMIFDYIPGKGTQVQIKESIKGVVEGKDFNDGLLSIWLGEKPISTDLKKALL
jgi:hypothetical protein